MSVRTALRWLLLAAALASVAPPSAGAATLGGLTQLSGTSSCVTPDGKLDANNGVCIAAPEMNEANSMLISPDGKFAYVSGWRNNHYNLLIFGRDAVTGALSVLSGTDFCLSDNGGGAGGPDSCINARALGYSVEGDSMAMTKGGAFLYVGGWKTNSTNGLGAVAIFSRDAATGKLTQLAGKDGCITRDGSSEDGADTCADSRMLNELNSLTLSPDERTLYAASTGWSGADPAYGGVAIFSRDPATGKLTQLAGTDGCATFNGKSEDGDATCQDLNGAGYASALAITPDGKHAYLPNYRANSLAILSVDAATGKLSQPAGTAGCISVDGSSEDGAAKCQDTGVVSGAWHPAVSPDGQTLFLANYGASPGYLDPAIASFRIDAATGALTRVAGTDHCITNDGNSNEGAATCQDGRGLDASEAITISPDGRSLYLGNVGRGVMVVAVDPATGKLTQLAGKDGCLTYDGTSRDGADTCTDINGTGGSYRLALSPDQAFAYLPSDGDGGAGGSITAFSRQASPVCNNVTGATAFQSPFVLTLPCSDPNGDALTREIVAAPGHGTLSAIDQANGGVTYTPAAAFNGGTDAFTFRATDAASSSAPAAATITVGAPPVVVVPPPDTTKPSCTVSGSTTVALKTRTISLRCNERATVALGLTLPASVAKKLKISATKTVKIGSAGSRVVVANTTTKIKLTITSKALKRLKKLSKSKLGKLRPTLTITATDTAKNKAVTTKALKLKR
jgi:6-phosphogluconolactonase (cycloisomerase 2 family)